jgi:Ca2+/Na+ antiporter
VKIIPEGNSVFFKVSVDSFRIDGIISLIVDFKISTFSDHSLTLITCILILLLFKEVSLTEQFIHKKDTISLYTLYPAVAVKARIPILQPVILVRSSDKG